MGQHLTEVKEEVVATTTATVEEQEPHAALLSKVYNSLLVRKFQCVKHAKACQGAAFSFWL